MINIEYPQFSVDPGESWKLQSPLMMSADGEMDGINIKQSFPSGLPFIPGKHTYVHGGSNMHPQSEAHAMNRAK